jgi:adenine C2-methylase RlmN of 23S rRNA A2503 and tRNA A37
MNIERIKTFANGWVAASKLKDNRVIEMTSTCLPMSTEIRLNPDKVINEVDITDGKLEFNFWNEKWMIGISTQSGCPEMCKFCAVNTVTKQNGWRNLTDEEIVEQVELAITRTKELYNVTVNPVDVPVFRILFTRMGEPTRNIDNVISAARTLKQKYPNVRIQISTIGTKKTKELIDAIIALENEFDTEDWIELQFSIHSTDNDFRSWLQNRSTLDNEELNELGKYYYNQRNRQWKVTLNFALAKSTPFNVDDLKEQFDNKIFFIKISPINENVVSDENKLKTRIEYKNTI